jgi:hypothetical protein
MAHDVVWSGKWSWAVKMENKSFQNLSKHLAYYSVTSAVSAVRLQDNIKMDIQNTGWGYGLH